MTRDRILARAKLVAALLACTPTLHESVSPQPRPVSSVDAHARQPALMVGASKIEILAKIPFPPNTAAIPPASFAVLDEVAGVLKEHSELGVWIEGNRDPTEKESLSFVRALEVRKALENRGVNASHMSIRDNLSLKPSPDRDKSRRVEFVVFELDDDSR